MKQPKAYQKTQPKFRWTIARKISGLASILIFFIFLIIIYSLFALKNIRADLQEIAQLDVPLTEISNAVEIQQLEQQISFDELLRLAQQNDFATLKNKNQIEQKFIAHKNRLEREINRGIILSHQGLNLDSKAQFQKINRSLLLLQQESRSLNDLALEIIQTLNSNNYPQAQTIDRLLAKDEQFKTKAITLINSIQDFTHRRLAIAEKHEQTFFLVNISLGIAAILLGILLSLIIIVSIKTNLFRLSKQMSEVRQAMATKQSILPTSTNINSSDEIGELAAEISQTIANFSAEIRERERLSANLKEIATTDKLTGAFNRLKWEENLSLEIDKTQQNNQDLSVIIFDIDFFKKVNDTYGHDVGDMVLIEVVKVAQQQIRTTDSLYRIGGEEFVILAPSTDKNQVLILAERIRKAMENHIFQEVNQITISMGITQFKESDDSQQFIKRADLALYQSKKGGRNQVNAY